MKNSKLKIAYWVSTVFVALICFYSGVQNIIITDFIKEANAASGIPMYLSPFLGVIKILGVITILIPQLKRFHEVAYAGLFYYFIGATYVNIATSGKSAGLTLIILIAVIISYFSSQKLASTNPQLQ